MQEAPGLRPVEPRPAAPLATMSATAPVQLVQLTPPGRGAIATLLLEGSGAAELLRGCFLPNNARSPESLPAGRPVVGRFGPDRGQPEEVVVCRRSDDCFELHCHGGRAALNMLRLALVAAGGQAVPWEDWAHSHHGDPITAAARLALAEARTQRTAAILLDQYHGALRRAFDQIEQTLRNQDTPGASRQIDVLLARAELGRHLTQPWQVVLCGGPNVGKSSLINALVGYPRAIVHGAPGTTRDVLSATTAIDGWPVELSDTAGLDPAPDSLQQAAVRRAREKHAQADLLVLVVDATRAWYAADQALLDESPRALVVHNKSDLPPAPGARPRGLSISATNGDGIDALALAIGNRLVPQPPTPGSAVPFTAEQVDCLASYRLRATAPP